MHNCSVISGLGVVTKCTLTGSVKTLSHGTNSYCMAYMGQKGQNAAMEECKKLNAKLPLPKNKEEAEKFRKITLANTWIGIRDFTMGGVKANWKDVEGNPIGNAFVNSRVTNLLSLLFLSYL